MAKGASRDLQKEAAWRRRLSRHGTSGQSVRAWCRKHRVTETAFHWWRRELARRDAEAQTTSFVPVHVTGEPAGSGGSQIEIVLADGRRIRVHGPVNRQMLTDVLGVLASTSPSAVSSGSNGSDKLERRAC
jgi:hypothetical protein